MVENSKTKPTSDWHWGWLIAPVLAAIYPTLTLYADSIRDANERDALICGLVVVVSTIAVAYLLRFVYSGTMRSSVAAAILVMWCFAFSSFVRLGRYVIEPIQVSRYNDYILYGFWLVLIFPVMILLWRYPRSDRRVEQLYRFVLLACIASVGLAAIKGVRGYLQVGQTYHVPGPMWGSELEAMPAAWKPGPIPQHRDIYYVLLDRYGSEQALRRFFGFDNSKFCDELEKRGFLVDRKAVTSYPMTSTSMASTLNMRYLNPRVEEPSDYFDTVQTNEVARLFIQAGYTYYFFGNQYEYLRKSMLANYNVKISMLPNEFADSLANMTPFRPLIGREHKRQFVINKFDELGALPKNPALKFTYAHFLVPHPPYAFARDGSAQTELNRATRPENELYIDQLVATNPLVLQAIDRILSASAVKPIIILQADEGPYLMAGDESLSPDEKIAKRLGVLNAWLIPDDDIRQKLAKPLLPVNTFRFLFKEYFGAPIETLPNRSFFWEKPESTGAAAPGTKIIDVTDELPKLNSI